MLGLINSLTEHNPEIQLVVYDIGLTSEEAEIVQQWLEKRGHIFRTFDFDKYPPHFALNHKTWAWKPAIIKEVVDEFERVLWYVCFFRIFLIIFKGLTAATKC